MMFCLFLAGLLLVVTIPPLIMTRVGAGTGTIGRGTALHDQILEQLQQHSGPEI